MNEQYLALIRGINVGGNKKVPMADLQHHLHAQGFKEVKTYLASGNIIFKYPKTNLSHLQTIITDTIKANYHFIVPVVILTNYDLHNIIAKNPFSANKMHQVYATFLSDCIVFLSNGKFSWILVSSLIYSSSCNKFAL